MQHKRLERLVLFSEVAERLSFAKAAEHLKISKGYLSDQIKTLEQEMSTPLLIRTTRSVRLTEEGKKVLASTNDIKFVLTDLERRLVRLDGNIRITAPKIFTEHYLIPIIAAFRQKHPEVTFDLNTSYTPYDLNQSHFDMAFRATKHPPENMVAKKLCSYRHTLAASQEYLDKHSIPQTPYLLSEHQCLAGEEQCQWQFSEGKVTVLGSIISNDNNVLKQFALAGEGIVRLPDYYLHDEIRQNKLVEILNDYQVEGFDIYLVFPTATRETARLRLFIDFVSNWFKSRQ